MSPRPERHDEPLHLWAERLEGMLRARELGIVDRVAVLASTGSTQDAARQFASGRPGLAVLAGVQTAGRGRLGRAWSDDEGRGLAVTVALDGERWGVETLALAAGLAACRACERALDRYALGLRWPNDVVERGRDGRKVSGVLIERDGPLALVGIGINVLHERRDFPPEIRDRAASLAMLGCGATRLDVAESLLVELDRALGMGPEDLRRAWLKRDVLFGTRRTFIHNGRPVSGTVEGIDPASRILVRTNYGNVVSLPALSTSMVHE